MYSWDEDLSVLNGVTPSTNADVRREHDKENAATATTFSLCGRAHEDGEEEAEELYEEELSPSYNQANATFEESCGVVDLEDETGTKQRDGSVENVMGAVHSHVSSCFQSVDVSLFFGPPPPQPTRPAAENDGEASAAADVAEPYQVLSLCPKMRPYRGHVSLTPKGKIVYGVDDSNADGFHAFCHAVPEEFLPFHSPTFRFFSIYSEMPLPAQTAEENDTNRKRTGIITQYCSKKESPVLYPGVVRVERLVSHPVTQGCMKASGMKIQSGSHYTLYWGPRWKDEREFAAVGAGKKVNHFPGTWMLGRKDALARLVQKFCQRVGIPSFMPETFLLPIDEPKLRRAILERGACFIAKPPASARGKGIFLIAGGTKWEKRGGGLPSQLTDGSMLGGRNGQQNDSDDDDDDDDDSDAAAGDKKSNDKGLERIVVQRYVPNPLLVNGFKVDLRVYAVVTSYDPLRIYLFNEGLVRFATKPYRSTTAASSAAVDFGDDDADYAHLTNYSINKKSADFVKTNEANEDGTGSKWTLHALARYFNGHGMDWKGTWEKVAQLIVKTILAAEAEVCAKLASTVKFRSSCFELYGVDVLLDDALHAHLLEVNVLPSLACGSAVDKHVKGHMIADLLTLVGIPVNNHTSDANGSNSNCSKPNDIPSKPVNKKKTIEEALKNDWHFSKCTDDDKHVLIQYEMEISRKGGFELLFPHHRAEDLYCGFAAPALTSKYYNVLLHKWEKLKRSPKTDLAVLSRWLRNEIPTLPGAPKAPKEKSNKVNGPLPPQPPPPASSSAKKTTQQSSESTPEPPRRSRRSSSITAGPSSAQVRSASFSSPSLAKSRVSSLPKLVTPKQQRQESTHQKALLHVQTFNFIDVPK